MSSTSQKKEYTETALISAYCYYNERILWRAYTTAAMPNHIWRPLVEKAGYKIEDIPKPWDAFYDFFKDVHRKLRAQGSTRSMASDSRSPPMAMIRTTRSNYFLIAYGGQDIVTRDDKLRLDDPKIREAAIKALTYPTTAYKEGFVPPGAINWNDADDNNATAE